MARCAAARWLRPRRTAQGWPQWLTAGDPAALLQWPRRVGHPVALRLLPTDAAAAGGSCRCPPHHDCRCWPSPPRNNCCCWPSPPPGGEESEAAAAAPAAGGCRSATAARATPAVAGPASAESPPRGNGTSSGTRGGPVPPSRPPGTASIGAEDHGAAGCRSQARTLRGRAPASPWENGWARRPLLVAAPPTGNRNASCKADIPAPFAGRADKASRGVAARDGAGPGLSPSGAAHRPAAIPAPAAAHRHVLHARGHKKKPLRTPTAGTSGSGC